ILAATAFTKERPRKNTPKLINKFFLVAPTPIENGTESLTIKNPKIAQYTYIGPVKLNVINPFSRSVKKYATVKLTTNIPIRMVQNIVSEYRTSAMKK